MLVLDDARKGHIRAGVVDHHRLLEEALRRLLNVLLLEAQRAVLQRRHALRGVVGIDLPRVHQQPMLRQQASLARLEEVAIEPDGDVWVAQQHVLKDARVAARGQRLPRVAKVAVVGAGAARQAHKHAGVQLSRVLVPLLLGVVLEHALVEQRPHAAQRRLLAILGLVDLGPPRIKPRQHLLLRVHIRVEERVDRLLHRRHRHRLVLAADVGHACPHAVLVGHPLGEALHVLAHSRELGVEEVYAVQAHADAVPVKVVVAVATDVIALVQDQALVAKLLERLLSDDAPAEAAPHDDQVVVVVQPVHPTEVRLGLRQWPLAGLARRVQRVAANHRLVVD
mmetsp:Transcript_9475/g.29639  ORF Transcript_9475/g.29639 Transcript_9475/m.29639 type:complete len:338 (+) Transcript_9475:426-1439(+)